jgi:phenylacetate-CoA ligase
MNIIRQALLPILYRWRGSKQLEYYNYLKKNQWNSLEENLKIQKKLIYDILKFSFNDIPYYKSLNINFGSFKEDTIFEDIKNIPFLTKKELREEYDNLYIINPKLKRIYPDTSGGSTGEPTKFMKDNYYGDWTAATKILYDEWAGLKIGDAKIKLWGSERDIFGQTEGVKHRLAKWTGNLKILNSFKMSNKDMHRYIDEINNFQPKLILTYVQSIYELSKYIKNNKLDVYSPGAIMTSAGILYPEYRELIQLVFKCPVYDRYGSREVGDMACECEKHNGLHLNVFNHFIEIIDKGGNDCRCGEMGEVVVTTLRNYTMPLIRFKTGDMAIALKKDCSCKRGLPLLKKIAGRTVDIFKNENGDLIDGEYFTHLFYFKDYINKFQVVQEKIENIIVRLVLDNKESFIKNKSVFDEITDKIKLVMGENVKIEYQLVDEIPANQSGKHRYTISKVYH